MPPETENESNPKSGYPGSVVELVAKRVMAARFGSSPPLRVGISGLQGSGKSTLSTHLGHVLARSGVSSIGFSLDDFYLTHTDRRQLARHVHPLLATRGVPGTHDIAWLSKTMDQLAIASTRSPVAIPRFDKRADDRAAVTEWQQIDAPPHVILLDGWCVGVTAQSSDALNEPANALERDEDGDGVWRRWVNGTLHEHYEPLWQTLNLLIVLQSPSFQVVERWRGESEASHDGIDNVHAMSRGELERFIAHYERISRHALATLPAHADLLLQLDDQRNVDKVDPPDSRQRKRPSRAAGPSAS